MKEKVRRDFNKDVVGESGEERDFEKGAVGEREVLLVKEKSWRIIKVSFGTNFEAAGQ